MVQSDAAARQSSLEQLLSVKQQMWDSKLSDMSLKPTMLSCKVNYVQLCWLETHTLKPKTSVPSAGDHLGPRRIWDIRRRRGLIPTKDQDEGSGRRVQERGNDSHLSEDYGKYSLIPVICFFLFTPLSGILTTVFTSFRCFGFFYCWNVLVHCLFIYAC